MGRLDGKVAGHHGGHLGDGARKRLSQALDEGVHRARARGTLVHDLRRSSVRHLIRGGVAPHTVMTLSGHRTASMLKRYDIIDVDDLRRGAGRASDYQGEPAQIVPLKPSADANTDSTPAADVRG